MRERLRKLSTRYFIIFVLTALPACAPRILGLGTTSVIGSTLNPSKNVCVSNTSSNLIATFDLNKSGDVPPLNTIGGGTTINPYTSIAVDPSRNEVFVSDSTNNTINVFSRTANGSATALRSISGSSTNLANGIYSIAIDPVHEELFVLDAYAFNSLFTFNETDSGNIAPKRILGGGFRIATQVIYNANTDLITFANSGFYRADSFLRTAASGDSPVYSNGPSDYSAGPTTVGLNPTTGVLFMGMLYSHSIYLNNITDNGTTAEFQSIATSAGDATGAAIVYDSVGNQIWNLSTSPPGFSAYNATTGALNKVIAGNLTGSPNGLIAFDPVNNELWAVTSTGFTGPAILTFDASSSGNVSPKRIIGNSNLNQPSGIYADLAHNELFVANQGGNSVTVYALSNGNGLPLRMIQGASTELSGPTGISLSPDGSDLFVSNTTGNSILRFNRTDNGNIAPQTTITGTNTLLSSPLGIAIDPSTNYLWVANSGNNSILVFSFSDDGNIAPAKNIAGSSTGLSLPQAVAIDSENDSIYVTNINNSITSYSTTSTGNILPQQTIGGALTKLNHPYGVVIDPESNTLIVTNEADSKILVFSITADGDVAPQDIVTSIAANGLASPTSVTLCN